MYRRCKLPGVVTVSGSQEFPTNFSLMVLSFFFFITLGWLGWGEHVLSKITKIENIVQSKGASDLASKKEIFFGGISVRPLGVLFSIK